MPPPRYYRPNEEMLGQMRQQLDQVGRQFAPPAPGTVIGTAPQGADATFDRTEEWQRAGRAPGPVPPPLPPNPQAAQSPLAQGPVPPPAPAHTMRIFNGPEETQAYFGPTGQSMGYGGSPMGAPGPMQGQQIRSLLETVLGAPPPSFGGYDPHTGLRYTPEMLSSPGVQAANQAYSARSNALLGLLGTGITNETQRMGQGVHERIGLGQIGMSDPVRAAQAQIMRDQVQENIRQGIPSYEGVVAPGAAGVAPGPGMPMPGVPGVQPQMQPPQAGIGAGPVSSPSMEAMVRRALDAMNVPNPRDSRGMVMPLRDRIRQAMTRQIRPGSSAANDFMNRLFSGMNDEQIIRMTPQLGSSFENLGLGPVANPYLTQTLPDGVVGNWIHRNVPLIGSLVSSASTDTVDQVNRVRQLMNRGGADIGTSHYNDQTQGLRNWSLYGPEGQAAAIGLLTLPYTGGGLARLGAGNLPIVGNAVQGAAASRPLWRMIPGLPGRMPMPAAAAPASAAPAAAAGVSNLGNLMRRTY